MAKRKPRLPGMEPDIDPKIDKAAENYLDAAAEFSKVSHRREEMHTRLLDLMKEKGFDTYEYEDRIISIDHKEKDRLKIKKKDDPT